jgi:hypothetical protein
LSGSYKDDLESDKLDTSILKYTALEGLDRAAYDLRMPEETSSITPGLWPLPISGTWSGYCVSSNDIDTYGLMQIIITSIREYGVFVGSGIDAIGSFDIHGEYLKDNHFEATFTRKHAPGRANPIVPTFCIGKADMESRVISGEWGVEKGHLIGKITLRPIPVQFYPFRYLNHPQDSNSARARWSFACAVVLDQVRRRLWSWSYFKDRFIARRRYTELYRRRYLSDVLSDVESKELSACERSLSPVDTRFYRSIARSHYSACIHL